jgi:hypothetical protein
MDSKYKSWEDQLKKLKDDFEKELAAVRAAKVAIYEEKSDKLQKLPGKYIQDDERIILSAPEIIIGNVNMGGMLNPGGSSNLIIRGNNVFLEGVGNSGQVTMRAPSISQIAEDPGIDGEEHVVCATSKIVSQATEITIDSSTVPNGGTFLTPDTTPVGSVSIRADKDININAVKSKNKLAAKAKEVTDQWASNAGKQKFKSDADDAFAQFEKDRKEIDKLLETRDKLVKKGKDDDNAIRTDYRDLDELNIRIDELSLDLAKRLYACSRMYARLAEGERRNKCLKALQDSLGGISDDDFKKTKTETTVNINSEQINLKSVDGDGNDRTCADAGLSVKANSVRFDGIFNQEGVLEETNRLSVTMRNISVKSESKSNTQYGEDGQLKSCDCPAVGSFVVRSKDIVLESTDYEMADKKYKEKSLNGNGSISLRSKKVELSTVGSSNVDIDDSGKLTKATYTSEGDIILSSKNVSIKSVDGKIEGDKYEETGLTPKGTFSVRAENFAFSATDKEGKAAGSASINAKEVIVRSTDVDPESKDIKQVAEGGKVEILAKDTLTYGADRSVTYSEKQTYVIGQEEASLHSGKLTELTQDGNVVRLEGGKVEISGSKNTLYGETTINVLKSPSITVDNLTASKAIKAPNLSDGVMVDTKNTSPSNAKSKAEEPKKPEESPADMAAATAEADRKAAASMLADLWKRSGDEALEEI